MKNFQIFKKTSRKRLKEFVLKKTPPDLCLKKKLKDENIKKLKNKTIS